MKNLLAIEPESPMLFLMIVLAVFIALVIVGFVINYFWERRQSSSNAKMQVALESKFIGKYEEISGFPAFIQGTFKEVFKQHLFFPSRSYVEFGRFEEALRQKFGAGYKIIFMLKAEKNLYPHKLVVQITYNKEFIILEMTTDDFTLVTDKEDPPTKAIIAGDYVDYYDYYNTEKLTTLTSVVMYTDSKTTVKQSIISDLVKDPLYCKAIPKLTPMPESPSEKKAKIRKIIYVPGQGFDQMIEEMRVFAMHPEELSLNYAPCEVEFRGEKANASMAELMEIMPISIDNRENILIFGVPGAGKTILAEFILYHAKQVLEDKLRIFYIPSNMIEQILTPEFGAYFSTLFKPTVKNLIFMDECQRLLSANLGISDSPVLEMMSGSQKELYNLSFVMAFNSKLQDLDRAIFRAGRAGLIIHLKHIPAEQARLKLAQLKERCDEDHFIDEDRFEKLLSSPNFYFDGDTNPYAQPGEITLADIYSCQMPKAKHDILQEIFNKKIFKKPTVPTKKLVRPR